MAEAQASLLGEREVRRWIRLATTLVASHSRSSDLVLAAMVRARFCELQGRVCSQANPICFWWGCFR